MLCVSRYKFQHILPWSSGWLSQGRSLVSTGGRAWHALRGTHGDGGAAAVQADVAAFL